MRGSIISVVTGLFLFLGGTPAFGFTPKLFPDIDAMSTPPKSSIAIGSGLMWFQGFKGAEGDQAIPVISLEVKRSARMSQQLDYELSMFMHFHDFETVGDIYSWFFAGDARDHALRLGTGWMALALVPMAGANFGAGMGVNYSSAETSPNIQLGVGVSSWLLFRFSNHDFYADWGFGPYVVLGTDLHKGFGLNARISYTVPFYRRFIAQESINIITVTANMVFPF